MTLRSAGRRQRVLLPACGPGCSFRFDQWKDWSCILEARRRTAATGHGRADMAVRFNDNLRRFELEVVEMAGEGAAMG